MRLKVLLFASLKDELGGTLEIELGDGGREDASSPTVASLRAALEVKYPILARFGRRALVAVNETYATDNEPLREGDTIAVLPPVAGG